MRLSWDSLAREDVAIEMHRGIFPAVTVILGLASGAGLGMGVAVASNSPQESAIVIAFDSESVGFCNPGEEIQETNYTYDSEQSQWSTPVAAKKAVEEEIRGLASRGSLARLTSDPDILADLMEIKAPQRSFQTADEFKTSSAGDELYFDQVGNGDVGVTRARIVVRALGNGYAVESVFICSGSLSGLSGNGKTFEQALTGSTK